MDDMLRDLLSLFLFLRSCGHGHALADAVVNSEPFRERLRRALHLRLLHTPNYSGLHEHVCTLAQEGAAAYLIHTCGSEFREDGTDAFAGWLYCRIREQVDWALEEAARRRERQADNLPGLFTLFLLLQARGQGRALANAVIESRPFAQRFQRALRLGTLQVPNHYGLHDDVCGLAQQRFASYLSRTCGSGFHGEDHEAFGGWLYCRSRDHVAWALGELRCQHAGGCSRLPEGGNVPAPPVVPAEVYARALQGVAEQIARMPQELRIAATHLIEGLPATETARALGCSPPTAAARREEAYARLRATLAEDWPG